MIKSMTGFGRGQLQTDRWEITAEIRTVNHRYFEYSSRLPRAYGFLDDRIKNYVQQTVSRGKTDVFITVDDRQTQAADIRLNVALADAYYQALQQLAERYGLTADVTPGRLASYPDVLSVTRAETDEEELWQLVRQALDGALQQLVDMREREGRKLAEDVSARAAEIEKMVTLVEQRGPELTRDHMEKMQARMQELLKDTAIDPARLLTEAAIYADKTAVAEETVRLRSHLEQLRHMLEGEQAVGRKLDFLVQEINRETNTIGSKIQDLQTTRTVVDMKAEIEKIREQIQNIE
ncbi:MAG: YicC family protein [Clostridia bacterium]|nr:YicC family protein [Clostridia bacterium]